VPLLLIFNLFRSQKFVRTGPKFITGLPPLSIHSFLGSPATQSDEKLIWKYTDMDGTVTKLIPKVTVSSLPLFQIKNSDVSTNISPQISKIEFLNNHQKLLNN